MSSKVKRKVTITSTPWNSRVGQILTPPLKATLQMRIADKMVRTLSETWAQVDLLELNGGDVSAYYLDGIRTALPDEPDLHHGELITADFKFGNLKILREGTYRFRVTLHRSDADENGAPTVKDLGLEDVSSRVTITQ